MNSRGAIAWEIVIWIIFLAAFFGMMFYFTGKKMNDGEYWEDYYAKKIAGVVNQLDIGEGETEVLIDMHHASKIARRNGIADPRYIINFDGKTNEVVVSLRKEGETRFTYFSDVIISGAEIELGELNKLGFKVIRRGGDGNEE